MATRSDLLQRIRMTSPCRTSWEAMEGDHRRRHCAECSKQVYDFARLTESEIAALIVANPGGLCARLTYRRGQLVTLAAPAPPFQPAARRTSPVAAAAVAALLGLTGPAFPEALPEAAAAPPQSAGPEAGAAGKARPDRPRRTGVPGSSLSGQLTREGGIPVPRATIEIINLFDGRSLVATTGEDGAFSFPSLQPGLYTVEILAGRFSLYASKLVLAAGERRQLAPVVSSAVWDKFAAGESSDTITVGGAGYQDPLREAYAASSLVALATVEGSVTAPGKEGGAGESRTDLLLSSVLKGATGERIVTVFHREERDDDRPNPFRPGEKVLAFLVPREPLDGRRGSDGYAPAAIGFSLKRMSEADPEPYTQRIAALAAIIREGADDPASRVEWLVTTAENPWTRKEAVEELHSLAWKLRDLEDLEDLSPEHYPQAVQGALADFLAAGGQPARETNPAVLAAFLTGEQRERLFRALLRTDRLTKADLDLYRLLRPWDQDRLLGWLIEQLQAAQPVTEENAVWVAMLEIAEALEDSRLLECLYSYSGEETELVRRGFLAALRSAGAAPQGCGSSSP